MSNGFTIPSMTKRVNLTNLVPAMSSLSFSVGSSSGTCEMSTAHVKYGSTALCNIGVAGYNEMYVISSQKFQLIPDHLYYACYEVYQETKLGSGDFFWPSASPSIFGGQAFGNAGTWKKCSNVTNRTTFSAGEYPVRLDFNNGGTAGKAWYDGLMLIDLTEAFGAGNEPSNAWCQANIPYFTGTTALDIPVDSPIQKLVQGLTIPEGVVTQIADATGRVLWSAFETAVGVMYFRPSGDISVLGHSLNPSYSEGAYTLISEEIADDNSTYIHSSTNVNGSTFSMDCPDASNIRSVSAASLIVRSRYTGDVESAIQDYKVSVDNELAESVTVNLTDSYITNTINLPNIISSINNYISSNGTFPPISLELSDDRTLNDMTKASGGVSTTQIYIELTCEYIVQ